jgi:transcription elongation factor SPT6
MTMIIHAILKYIFCSYRLKYLKKKPVRDLTGEQYLKLTMATDDKLLEIHISEQIEGNTGPSYLEELKQLYQKVSYLRCDYVVKVLRKHCTINI